MIHENDADGMEVPIRFPSSSTAQVSSTRCLVDCTAMTATTVLRRRAAGTDLSMTCPILAAVHDMTIVVVRVVLRAGTLYPQHKRISVRVPFDLLSAAYSH